MLCVLLQIAMYSASINVDIIIQICILVDQNMDMFLQREFQCKRNVPVGAVVQIAWDNMRNFIDSI
jgi:hypothetical protein